VLCIREIRVSGLVFIGELLLQSLLVIIKAILLRALAIEALDDGVVLGGPMVEDPDSLGASRRWITTAVEHPLRGLEIDHGGLYRIHHVGSATDLEEVFSALILPMYL
jgi:hypothetical protein